MRKALVMSCACVLLIVAVSFLPLAAQGALSLGADPSSLSATVERGKSSDLSLYVINTGTSDIDCTVYVDDAYSSWVSFDRASFTLGPNSSREVAVTVHAPANGTDQNDFYVYIVGSAHEGSGTPVSAGLKIPVSLNLTDAHALPTEYIIVLVLVVAAVLIAALLVLRRRRG